MSRTRSFLNGALFAYLYQGSAMVIGLWLTPFYIRTLGPKDYGTWLVGMQVLVMLLLCDFGVLAVVPRDVARARGLEQSQPGSQQLALIIGQTTKVVLIQTFLIALISLGLFLFRPAAAAGLEGPVGLALFVFVITYPMRLFPAVLQGLQDLKFLGQLRLWMWALSTALTIVLLLAGTRFYALVCGWCLQQIVHDIVAFYRLRRIRPDLLTLEGWNTTGPFHWRWFTRGAWVNVGQIGYALTAGTDLLIVGRALGPAAVVVYSCTNKLITVLQNQPQILASVALPGLSELKIIDSRQSVLLKITSLTQAMLVLVGAVFCIVIAVNQQFVTLWLGPSFFGGVKLTLLLLLNFLVRQIDYTLALALFAFGHERYTAIRCLLDGLVSVVLASILVKYLGFEGVVLGALCGGLLVSIPMDVFVLAREFEVSIFQFVRPYIPFLWRFALIGVAGVAIVTQFGISGPFNLAIASIVIGLAYSIIVLPYVWRTPLRSYIQSTASTIWSLMPGRNLGWSNDA
jgi:O-antigen/teichoic acid export membrane protein